MTEPDLVEVEVPAEEVRTGDRLVDAGDALVRGVILDAVPEYVYAFTPEQHPYPRGAAVRVRRPRPSPDPVVEQLAEVRDLALALAEVAQINPQTTPLDKVARVKGAADKVRARLEQQQETSTDGTDRPEPAGAPPAAPEPAPVLGQPPAPAGDAAAPTAPGKAGKPARP